MISDSDYSFQASESDSDSGDDFIPEVIKPNSKTKQAAVSKKSAPRTVALKNPAIKPIRRKQAADLTASSSSSSRLASLLNSPVRSNALKPSNSTKPRRKAISQKQIIDISDSDGDLNLEHSDSDFVQDENDIFDFAPNAEKPKPKNSIKKSTKKTVANKESLPLGNIDRNVENNINTGNDMIIDDADFDENGIKTSSKIGSDNKKTLEEIYQKKTQLEHILLRPDSYIGSTEFQVQQMWVFENDSMVLRDVTYAPGLYKIFDEIIVNAADNKVRDPSMNCIKISVDNDSNVISVWNNGKGIPIEMHAKEGIYIPELIFGHLLTSSNYDDDEQKVTGGRNGYGAKLCNIFSKEFDVETGDSKTGRKFVQNFYDNMSRRSTPRITTNERIKDYTQITFKPDLAKFGMDKIDTDFEALINKRAYDLAGILQGVDVYLNGTKLKIKNFKDYVNLYTINARPTASGAPVPVIYERINERWEIAFSLSEGQFQQVSFVNSICTVKGGSHVNHVTDQIVTDLIKAVQKKDKKNLPVKPFQVKSHLWVFVNCSIVNPAFDSQTKETLTLRPSAFGSKCPIKEEFMKKVLKSGVVDNIMSFVKFKQDQLLKKTDGTKRTRITGLAKLDDANNAGTKNGQECTLILTEGDSAKTLAVSGLSAVGRDNYGVFPLRGKLLNVRESTHAQIMANAEINAIKQIMGLQHGKAYSDTKSLRYGHLMIMTDQDHDGSHIKGLIVNLFDHFWPGLLELPGFLLEFITPIVKVWKGKEGNGVNERSFFTIPEYELWKEENNGGKGWNFKYYKGLGTSTPQDAKSYFSNMERHLKSFSPVKNEERGLIDMAFSKKKADERKEWLRQFQPGTYMDHSQESISLDDFINKELILFSLADNARSIPCVLDGLKPGQRKILFSCFKKNLQTDIKVAQLAGYISEHSAYHHGEQSLCSTIVGMAQNFVGSNNIPTLEPRGQFGTRLQGGKDAASPRYIYTCLSKLATAIYNPADNAILDYLNEDGQSIEPVWYIPVLPMVLVNGAEGIGTGWSTSIPNYNPYEIVQNILNIMDGKAIEKMHPWYRGYTGSIEPSGPDKYAVTGIIKKLDNTTVEITELPLKTWTQSYKEDLESWLIGSDKSPAWIKDYKEYHTDSKVKFVVTLTEENMREAELVGLEKKFKLVSSLSTSNIVCFDSEGRIQRYSNIESILTSFYDVRRQWYSKRKKYLINQLTEDYNKADNKVRFVTEIIKGRLVVQGKKKQDIIKDLQQREYKPFFKNSLKKSNDNDDENENENDDTADHGYDYLLTMPIWSLSKEKVDQLIKQRDTKQNELIELSKKSINDLWREDLMNFVLKLDEFIKEMKELESYEAVESNKNKKGNSKKSNKKTIKKESSKSTLMDEDSDFVL